MAFSRTLGVSTSLLGNVIEADWPESAFAVLADSPIRTIEYLCVEDRYRDDGHIARVKQSAGEHGIHVRSVHAPFGTTDISEEDEAARRQSLDNVMRAFDVAVELGAGIVVIHGSREPIEDEGREGRKVQCVRSLNELCKRASQRGLTLALETLPRTCLANRSAEMRWFLDIVDGDLRVCYDVNHLTLYEDVRESVRALGDRIVTLHVSDHDGIDERHWIPGRGVIDWPGFVAALDEIGYDSCLLHEATDRELDLPGNLAAIAQAARENLGWDG